MRSLISAIFALAIGLWPAHVAAQPATETAVLDQACNAGDAAACQALGEMFEEGRNVAKDTARARGLYRKGCDAGLDKGCRYYAYALRMGIGGPKEPLAALPIYTRLCDRGMGAACDNLGDLYTDSELGEPDPEQGADLYRKACDGSRGQACTKLAELQVSRRIPQRDRDLTALYVKGCDTRNIYSCNLLAQRIHEGGFTGDLGRAALEGARWSCEEANNRLGCLYLGLIEMRGLGGISAFTRGVERVAAQCEAGLRAACLWSGNLSGWEEMVPYLERRDLPFSRTVTFAPLLVRHCLSGNRQACNIAAQTGRDLGYAAYSPAYTDARMLAAAACYGGVAQACQIDARFADPESYLRAAVPRCLAGDASGCWEVGMAAAIADGDLETKLRTAEAFVKPCEDGDRAYCARLAGNREYRSLLGSVASEADLASPIGITGSTPFMPLMRPALTGCLDGNPAACGQLANFARAVGTQYPRSGVIQAALPVLTEVCSSLEIACDGVAAVERVIASQKARARQRDDALIQAPQLIREMDGLIAQLAANDDCFVPRYRRGMSSESIREFNRRSSEFNVCSGNLSVMVDQAADRHNAIARMVARNPALPATVAAKRNELGRAIDSTNERIRGWNAQVAENERLM